MGLLNLPNHWYEDFPACLEEVTVLVVADSHGWGLAKSLEDRRQLRGLWGREEGGSYGVLYRPGAKIEDITDLALTLRDEAVEPLQPTLVIILAGINDVCSQDGEPLMVGIKGEVPNFLTSVLMAKLEMQESFPRALVAVATPVPRDVTEAIGPEGAKEVLNTLSYIGRRFSDQFRATINLNQEGDFMRNRGRKIRLCAILYEPDVYHLNHEGRRRLSCILHRAVQRNLGRYRWQREEYA